MKEFWLKRFFALRKLFVFGNVLLVILFLVVVVKDHRRGWKYYQTEYKRMEIDGAKARLKAAQTPEEKALAEAELRGARNMPIEIRQIWVEDLNAVDRCITCHVAYDPLTNPSMTSPYEEHPWRAPSASPAFDIHQAHNVEQFGCASCHGGQGHATEVEAAHGRVRHWEEPLLTGTLIQASCMKCHDNTADLYVAGENYTSELVRAKQLFDEHGCIGCHQVGGVGTAISVDLKEETSSKPLGLIDFAYTGLPRDEWTLAKWIKIHFTDDPAKFVPGDPEGKYNVEPIAPSAMPAFMMPEEDADALTAYILGLDRKGIPSEYLVLRAPEPKPVFDDPVDRGRWIYQEWGCGACHGNDARGGIRNFNYEYDVVPNLRRAAATFTRAEMKERITEGVPFVARLDPDGPQPPLYMPPWKGKIEGQDLEDLITYLFTLQE